MNQETVFSNINSWNLLSENEVAGEIISVPLKRLIFNLVRETVCQQGVHLMFFSISRHITDDKECVTWLDKSIVLLTNWDDTKISRRGRTSVTYANISIYYCISYNSCNSQCACVCGGSLQEKTEYNMHDTSMILIMWT